MGMVDVQGLVKKLTEAIARDDIDASRILIGLLPSAEDATDDEKALLTKPLHVAARDNYADLCQLLIDRGANVDGQDVNGEETLIKAVKGLAPDAIKLLINCGASVRGTDKTGRTTFHTAVVTATEECVRLFLDAGVDPDATDNRGRKPLHEAVRYDRVDSIKHLLEAGANIDSADNSRMTPLHYAARKGHIDSCRALVGFGATPSHVPTDEKEDYLTPFQMGVGEGQCAVVEYFVRECGEDIAQRTLQGKTMLDLASNHPEMKVLLRSLKTELAVADALVPGHPSGERTSGRRISHTPML